MLSALQHCPKLEALCCCHSPNILDDLANAACAKTLQRLTATKVSLTQYPATLDEGDNFVGDCREFVVEFWYAGELAAMRQMVERRILPQLKELELRTWDRERLVDVPKDELIALKNVCDRHGFVFKFSRYDEVIKDMSSHQELRLEC